MILIIGFYGLKRQHQNGYQGYDVMLQRSISFRQGQRAIIIQAQTMRKLEKSDKFFIEKMRAELREESDLNLGSFEGVSTIDQSSYDEFHNELLKNTKIRSIRICRSSTAPQNEKVKQHVVYELQVSTDQLCYKVWRRFREFYAFYKKIKKHLPKECVFPQKTYNIFVSSASQAIVEQRKIKLNLFLQDVLHHVLSSKDQSITLKLFQFIELKQTYEERYMIPDLYQKTSSEKGNFNRYYSLKQHHSQRKLGSFHQNSLEMLVAMINQPNNPSKHLKKLEEVIKNKKCKATNEEIKLIFLGFEDYFGVLKFGLTNSLESNRLAALQIMIDLLLPERNVAFERYEKMLEKLPIQLWKVEDISYLDSPLFKVHYFRLLKIFCQRAQKDNKKGEQFILKALFMFHQNLVTDYFQWKNIHSKEHKFSNVKSLHEFSQVDLCQKIEITQFMLEEVETELKDVKVYYYEGKNVLVLRLGSSKEMQEIREIGMKWNRFMQDYTVQEYTGLHKYTMNNQSKRWSPRIKIQEHLFQKEAFTTKTKSTLLPEEVQDPVRDIIANSDYKMTKQQTPFQFYSEFQEQIWVWKQEENCEMAILIKTPRDASLFEGSLLPWASKLAADALASFD